MIYWSEFNTDIKRLLSEQQIWQVQVIAYQHMYLHDGSGPSIRATSHHPILIRQTKGKQQSPGSIKMDSVRQRPVR